MNISDPRTDTEVMVEDGVLTRKQSGGVKKINLSDSVELSWSKETGYEHTSPTALVISSFIPASLFLMILPIFLTSKNPVSIIPLGMMGVIGLAFVGLFSYGIYRFENPEYEFPEYGVVYVKSNGVKMDIYTPEPEKLMNELS